MEDVEEPVVGSGQVVVDVQAAAVNLSDLLIMAGRYQRSMPPPFTPGSEFAGIVRRVGDGVTSVRPGTAVFGAAFVGAFAERIVVDADAVTPVPEGASLDEAAAFGVAYRTSYHALRSIAAVQPEEWVVVLGAAGGVGLAAVELAQHLGARVVAAASGPDKLDLCRARGAEAVVDYQREPLRDRIKELTGGGADVVVDPVGGRWSEQALRSLRWGGRFVVVGFASGEIPAIPLNLVLLKGVDVRGFEIGAFQERAPQSCERDRCELLHLFAGGQVHPHVSAVLPLEHGADALRLVADRRALGKVVIRP